MELDRYQRAAVETALNTVVTAGAGSGKTRTLSERFLHLVSKGVPVDRIITLTFTRKAMAEMFERIHRALLDTKDLPQIQTALKSFDRVFIGTFDSFCAVIARSAALSFAISPNFIQDEERCDALARETAIDFLYRRSDDPLIARLVAVNGWREMVEGFFVPLGQRYLTILGASDIASQIEKQQSELRTKCALAIDKVDKAIAAMGQYSLTGAMLDRKRKIEAIGWSELIEQMPKRFDSADEERFDQWLQAIQTAAIALESIKMTGGRKTGDNALFSDDVTTLREFAENIESIVATILSRADFRRLVDLIGEYREALNSAKRQTRLLTYQDVVSLAIEALRSDPELRQYYIKRFDHIMIDEFQDTNEQQKELIYLLALRPERAERKEIAAMSITASDLSDGKLFFVGDDKQSIYRFRGADVAVFRDTIDRIGAAGGACLSLPKNYRSQPALLERYNILFKHIMGAGEEPYEAGFEPFQTAFSPQPDARATTFRIWTIARSEGCDHKESEAFYIAQFLRDAIENKTLSIYDASSETLRPIRYRDCAILTYTNSRIRIIERYLRKFRVPYTLRDNGNLFYEAPATDSFSLFQLIHRPFDRLAYAATLRSPLANLSIPSIITLLREFRDGKDAPFELPAERLAEEDRARYLHIASCYHKLRLIANNSTVAKLFDTFWYRLGYRYSLLTTPEKSRLLDHYDKLFYLASKAKTLLEWLEMIQAGRRGDLHLPSNDEKQHGDETQIMTIHASKGLEFPLVILANADARTRQPTSGAPYYYSPSRGLSFNLPRPDRSVFEAKTPNYFYKIAKEENANRDLAERKRLIYVALTRAQSHCVVVGAAPGKQRADKSILDLILAGAKSFSDEERAAIMEQKPSLSEDALRDYRYPTPTASPRQQSGLPNSAADWRAIEQRYQNSPAIRFPRVQSNFGVEQLNERYAALRENTPPPRALPELPIDSLLSDSQKRAAFGTLCHLRIHQHICGECDLYRQSAQAAPPLPKIERLFPPERRDELIEAATLLARGFLESEWGNPVQTALSGDQSTRAESELAFMLAREVEGRVCYINGIIDLLVISPKQALIIDFKSDRHIIPGVYDLQLEAYRIAAAKLFDREFDAALYYLRDGSIERAASSDILGDHRLYGDIKTEL